MKTRKIELSIDNRRESIILPVNPATVEFQESQQNQKITLLNIGEVGLLGNRGLISTSLSSFFPSKKSPFYKYAKKDPGKYIKMLKGWMESTEIVRLIITDLGVNLAMTIDGITHTIQEGNDDIAYKIDLSEYRRLNVPSVQINIQVKENGLQARPDTQSTVKNHTVVSGDTLWAIAKKHYGNGAEYTKIFNANKDKIKNPDLIYPGQVLTIP